MLYYLYKEIIMKKILISILVVILLSACTSEKLTVTVIDGAKAHEMYLEGAILLDVRTMEEYMEYRLENSILIPVDNISEETLNQKISNKNTKIIVPNIFMINTTLSNIS
jgi:hypothetical protein